MKRHPFRMDSRAAVARRDGSMPIGGRASFVWLYGVLIPIACGVAPDGVEIALRRGAKPLVWHRITLTKAEAEAEISDHYPLQRASLGRLIASHRRRKAAA